MNVIAHSVQSETRTHTGGAGVLSPLASPIVSSVAGEGSLTQGCVETAHNFTNQRADWPRLVPVGINGTVDVFIFYTFHEG